MKASPAVGSYKEGSRDIRKRGGEELGKPPGRIVQFTDSGGPPAPSRGCVGTRCSTATTGGTLLGTLTTLSNLNGGPVDTLGQVSSRSLMPYTGQTVQIKFQGATNGMKGTVFLLEDAAETAVAPSAPALGGEARPACASARSGVAENDGDRAGGMGDGAVASLPDAEPSGAGEPGGSAAPAFANPKEDGASRMDEPGPGPTQEPVLTMGAVSMAIASEERQPSGASTGWNTHRSSHGGEPGTNVRDDEEEVYSPREAVMAYSVRGAATTGPRSPAGAKATYYYWDHLGTVRMTAGENLTAETVKRHDYEPYGLEMLPATNQAGNTHQFTGHERDLDTGFDYMHFRFYSGNIGWFMRPDNIPGNLANPQSWNLYSYVHGNPVNFSDPTRHQAASPEDTIPRNPGDNLGVGQETGTPKKNDHASRNM